MSPRARFAIQGIALAAVLYTLLRWLTASRPEHWWLGYATAAVAVMLAAQGVSWKRKLLFASVTAALSFLLMELVARTFLLAGAEVLSTSGLAGASHLYYVSFVVMQLLFLGMPLAALALFVGGRPTALWEAEEPSAR
jgi:hypothetical protein